MKKPLFEQVLMKLDLHYKRTGAYQKIVQVDDDAWIELLREMHKTLILPDETYNPFEVAILVKATVIVPSMYARAVCEAMHDGIFDKSTPIGFFRDVTQYIKKEFNVPF